MKVCDSGSSQFQLTQTSLVYQPLVPGVPPISYATTGGVTSRYQNPYSCVNEAPSGLVMVTSTQPMACGGVVALMLLESRKTTFVAGTPPIVTVAPSANAMP